MTIQNPEEYLNNIWDWAILRGCFGETRIEPTDIDGFVERNGRFLVIETKAPYVEVKTGQMITFKRLIDTGYFTIVLVWGKPGKPEKIVLMTRQTTIEYDSVDIEKLRKIVGSWFEWANHTPVPEFRE
jgi:hypothetical protein